MLSSLIPQSYLIRSRLKSSLESFKWPQDSPPKKHHHTPIARGMLEHTYRREQESYHVENKGGERKKRTLTVVPDVDG